jgi:hypothetical protein
MCPSTTDRNQLKPDYAVIRAALTFGGASCASAYDLFLRSYSARCDMGTNKVPMFGAAEGCDS